MDDSIQDTIEGFFRENGLEVAAGELQGTVQVVNRQTLIDLFRNAVVEAEEAAKRASAEGSGVSKMLDDYMRQAADLRRKEQSARRRIQELEFDLKSAGDRIQELESRGGDGEGGTVPASLLQSHLAVDVTEGESFFEETHESLVELETSLNEVNHESGSWDIVARVAELRSDFNTLREEYRRACEEFQSLLPSVETGSGDVAACMQLVEAVATVRGSVSEVHLIKKSVDFLSAVLHVG